MCKFRIKEKLEEIYTDNQGRNAIKLIRYFKKYNATVSYDNMFWQIKDVWNCIKTNSTYEVVEENVRYIKLAFPIVVNNYWNGNAQNNFETWNYNYNYIDKTETINGHTFDNVLLVEQKDDKLKNVIHRQYYIEKYAKNIGLVYKEIKDLYSNNPTINPITNQITPVENRIEKGVIYTQTYISHGTE